MIWMSQIRPAVHLSPRAGRGRVALTIRVRGSLRKRGRNRFKNSRYIAQHIVVPESQNTIIMIDKPFVAHFIARVFGVLASIDLNNEATIPQIKSTVYGPTGSCRTNLYPLSLRDRSRYQSALSAFGTAFRKRPARSVFISLAARMLRLPLARRSLPARGERLAPRMQT
jgi:hypothetical protein